MKKDSITHWHAEQALNKLTAQVDSERSKLQHAYTTEYQQLTGKTTLLRMILDASQKQTPGTEQVFADFVEETFPDQADFIFSLIGSNLAKTTAAS